MKEEKKKKKEIEKIRKKTNESMMKIGEIFHELSRSTFGIGKAKS